MAQGTFDMHSIIDVVLERECHHEGEQAQVPRKCRRLASNSGKTLVMQTQYIHEKLRTQGTHFNSIRSGASPMAKYIFETVFKEKAGKEQRDADRS